MSSRRDPKSQKRRLLIEGLEDRRLLAGVVTIGDSWAFLVASGAPSVYAPAPVGGFSNALGTVMAAYQPGVPVYNESFGGGTAAQMVGELYTPSGIIARINAHPDADVVWLSAGGNDLLLGQFGGGFWVGNPNNANVYAAVQANVQTIVDAILDVRPDIQVVVMGYDYINVWDMVSGSAGDTIRLNLGIGKTGIPGIDAIQNESLNNGMKDAENGKIAIANASRRVAHVNNWGLNNTFAGYSGYFGNFPDIQPPATYPPELYPYLPTPPSRMSSGDAIHLNNTGYTTLALSAELNFLVSAFSAANLALNTGTLAFGDTRIGTSSSLGVTASNAGANFSKVKNLQFGTASGAFGGGGQSFDPLFLDPTLGSDTANVSYSFTPTSHAPAAQSVGVTSDSGSLSLSLEGRGVGPTYSGPASVTFDPIVEGAADPSENFAILNVTADGDLGNLTRLTLKSAAFSGPDAGRFSLANFALDSVIAAGGGLNLDVEFDATGAEPGEYTAELTFTTDENAAFGAPGQQFSITLSATVEAANQTATVAGRHLFYNQSGFDGASAVLGAADDAAIASDKTAYLPGGGVAVFNNVSSYSRGINGIMIDLAGGGDHAAITTADFVFKVGNNNAPDTWSAAPAPSSIVVRTGAGASGSDRVEIAWNSGAVSNQWLEVQVLPTANTGLASADVHFWGNRIGDSGTGTPAAVFQTTSADAAQVFGNLTGSAAIDDLRDYNRSGGVTSADAVQAFNNLGSIVRLDVGAGGPFAPQSDSGAGAAVASALAIETAPAGTTSPPTMAPPKSEDATLKSDPAAATPLMLEVAPPRLRTNRAGSAAIAVDAALDDELLEALLDRL